jgi:hypothetical protein
MEREERERGERERRERREGETEERGRGGEREERERGDRPWDIHLSIALPLPVRSKVSASVLPFPPAERVRLGSL